MPQVSILVPNYNHARFLERRLDSIFSQTLQDFELIFLDDASTDDSLEVYTRFADDPRVRSCINSENTGNPFVQWNRGLDMASGDFVWIAESDDFAEPEFLTALVGRLEAHPDAGLATCRSFVTSAEGQDLEVFDAYRWFRDAARWRADYCNSGRDELTRYLLFQNTIPNASAVVVRRAVLEPGLRAPEDMQIAGDWSFWVAILLRSGICHVGRPLNHFRQPHAESQRSRTIVSGVEIMEGFRVVRQIEEGAGLTDSQRLFARLGLMRRWLSLASLQRIPWSGQRRIYGRLLEARFGSPATRALHVLLLTLTLVIAPVAGIPGFRWLARKLQSLAAPGAGATRAGA